MWPVGCSLESASPVGNEVLRNETENVRGMWIARGTTNIAILEGLQRVKGKDLVNGEPRFLNKSGRKGTYTNDGGYLVVCPLILVVVLTREGVGG